MEKDFQPGDAEALGAIKGMKETYGEPPQGFSVGESVTYTNEQESCRATIFEVGDDLLQTYIIAIHVPGHGRVLKQVHESELAYF